MQAHKFGIGLVGTGMVGVAHARSLLDLADKLEVRGVYSRDATRREAFAARYGLPAVDSAETLAKDAGLHGVIITTPPDQRIELVELFAAHGKHILMEKPVERTTAAASAIVDTCARHGVQLGIVFQHRFRAASRQLAALLAEHALGEVRVVQVAVPWWRPQAYYDEPGRGTYARDGGGVLLTQAIHSLDLVLSLAGRVTQVQALAATSAFHNMEAEDFVSAGLRFENGAVGSLLATTAAYPGAAESITLHCDLASARLEAGTLSLQWLDGRSEVRGEAAGSGGGADPMAFSHAWHASTIEDFVEAVQSGRTPAVPGREALRVHQLIDAVTASASSGRVAEVAFAE